MTIDLRYGDTIEQMKLIPDKSIDFICCDLPYGTTACKWDSIIDLNLIWEQYIRILKSNRAIVLFGSQPFTTKLISSNYEMFKYEWIWEKHTGSNFATLKIMPFKQHENILVFGKGKVLYNPQMQPKKENTKQRLKYSIDGMKKGETESNKHRRGYSEEMRNSDLRYPSSVQKFVREMGLHPTQKPVPLMEFLIKTYSNENDTILDNTFGSCTTGIACINTNRNFIGIENNMDYFNISLKRVEEKRKEKEFNVVTSFGDGM